MKYRDFVMRKVAVARRAISPESNKRVQSSGMVSTLGKSVMGQCGGKGHMMRGLGGSYGV